MNRRIFFRTVAAAGGSVFASALNGIAETLADDASVGVLVDETRCLGCRRCEAACAQSHGMTTPASGNTDPGKARALTESQWTVINRHSTTAGPVFTKTQCMHCAQPACVSACLTGAMHKTREGPVIWDESKCMGCRYCMLSCPFEIPKFEYDKTIPKILKCDFCRDRILEGKQPACVENCPAKVMLFGKRSDLIQAARQRFYEHPGRYYPYLYGEHEVGGTSWLYLSPAAPEELGFKRSLGSTPYPEFTKPFLYSVPVVLILWPAMLLALSKATESE